MTISIVTGRAVAKTILSVFNANWPCAEHRTSNARPYDLWSFAELSFRQWKYTDYLLRT